MKTQIEQLKDFHTAFGVNMLKSPAIPSIERCELRQRILEEEVGELKEAWENDDIVKVADGIIDCLYILLGTAHEFGMQNILVEMFDEVHRSNMSKLDINGKPIYREDGKVLKSILFSAPNLEKIINR